MRMMIVMMVRYIGTLGNHGSGDSKPRGVVVLIPLTNTLRDCNNEYTDYKDKYQREHHAEHPETKSKSHVREGFRNQAPDIP